MCSCHEGCIQQAVPARLPACQPSSPPVHHPLWCRDALPRLSQRTGLHNSCSANGTGECQCRCVLCRHSGNPRRHLCFSHFPHELQKPVPVHYITSSSALYPSTILSVSNTFVQDTSSTSLVSSAIAVRRSLRTSPHHRFERSTLGRYAYPTHQHDERHCEQPSAIAPSSSGTSWQHLYVFQSSHTRLERPLPWSRLVI